ncbi:DUF7668 domain-containing protein [Vibrio parahaemolyticus]|uniref:DUF7668 domain-containing protein n=2 Tax=Vibrio parahaemolyticus TaxID=670 RepID=UPI0011C727B6|nr:hypothetical protein [Vibrio parahaemolyticus]TXM07341.1 hypothetical protein FVP09_24175 [Vibrio parahaemolyticus]
MFTAQWFKYGGGVVHPLMRRYVLRGNMFKLTCLDKAEELKRYCQSWLDYLASQKFELADSLIDEANCYGQMWKKHLVFGAINDYFSDEREFKFDSCSIEACNPSFLEAYDGTLMLDFYLMLNGELSDLTVQFEFNPVGNCMYKVSIHDIHVL